MAKTVLKPKDVKNINIKAQFKNPTSLHQTALLKLKNIYDKPCFEYNLTKPNPT
jgi:hypothetical protein